METLYNTRVNLSNLEAVLVKYSFVPELAGQNMVIFHANTGMLYIT